VDTFFSVFMLPTALGLLMFGMGLSLTIEDFRRILINPRSLLAGLFSQMVLLPVLAFTIASISGLSPELKVGLIVIAACPGGATSNLITYLLRGNVALSISLTSVNSFLTLITTPLLVFLGLYLFIGDGQSVNLPLLPTIFKIFYITILPTSIGIYIRYRKPGFAINAEKPLRVILPVLYGIIYFIAILGGKAEQPVQLFNVYISVLPWAIAMNLIGMSLGFLLARSLRKNISTQITLAVEVGIQNSALAITIASSALFLNNYTMAIPSVVYGFFTFVSAVLFGLAIRRWGK